MGPGDGDEAVAPLAAGDLPALGIEDVHLDLGCGGVLVEFCTHADDGFLVVDALQLPGGAPEGEVDLGGGDEPDGAVDAGARVPAGVVLPGVVHAHGQDVVLAGAEVGCELVEEGGESAGAIAEQVAVEVHAGAVVHAFEVDVEAAGGCCCGFCGREVAAVPGDASGEVALAGAAVGRHGQRHTPVVGHADARPAAVVVLGAEGCGVVGEAEEPAVGERAGCAEGGLSQGCGGEGQQAGGEEDAGFHRRGVKCLCGEGRGKLKGEPRNPKETLGTPRKP